MNLKPLRELLAVAYQPLLTLACLLGGYLIGRFWP